ncbi:hypothetical protein F5884DRAFT_775304 [Xylogone sp. PMI_703]|nr:hypothetical protein F5884DRAFT_775304 [Xylogone sp. PMI_703]
MLPMDQYADAPMQATTTRPREVGGSFASRRGHATQISISDTSHHVTEAIGDMYGDEEYSPSRRDSRPLSFISSPLNDTLENGNSYLGSNSSTRVRPSPINGKPPLARVQTAPSAMPAQRNGSLDVPTPPSPSLSLRESSSSDAANTQFPLNDLDYESNPAAVAQELSNLQALRRMSMDVGNTSDPDLPSFQNVALMPSVAPKGNDDEDDPSRLFWVPARVHPELAPMEFKTFLENRVNSIKRRSGEQQSLSPDGLEPGSGGSLRRKKSMLSKQIDNTAGRGAIGYTDGAEQLERKKSLAQSGPEYQVSLEQLVKDPANAMKKLTLETNRQNMGGEVSANDDMPILPAAPGTGLRRSIHTTYRRGSLRKGERVPFSKRAGSLRGGTATDTEDTPASTPADERPSIGYPLEKVQSEPSTTENFSRPSRGTRRGQTSQLNIAIEPSSQSIAVEEEPIQIPQPGQLPRSQTFPRTESKQDGVVPKIVETPPPPENVPETQSVRQQFPERSSSQTLPPPHPPPQQPLPPEPPAKSTKRPPVERQNASTSQTPSKAATPSTTLNDMIQNPSPLPGSSARTDSLTFIPTYEEKKQTEKKTKKDDSESTGLKKSWGWFKGSDDKDKKDKKKEVEDKEAKKGKAKTAEKSHDNARLDVLQSSIETGSVRGRESLVLDRDSIDTKLQEERRKDRKLSGEIKKEKDGLFSSFFGSSKKKGDRDSIGKKNNTLRTLSPDPPHRELRPDIDYNWTRFSILEERAIYRMAHIKLANPRRALYSQVLLSNFMYSYLAKVQQMHPQMQVPISPAQKREEEERRRKEQEEQYQQQLLQQQQQQQEQYQYDYHRGIAQYAEPQDQKSEGVNYIDDSQIYDYDHQDDGNQGHRPQAHGENGYDQSQHYGHHDYYQYDQRHHELENEDDGDMW